MEYDNLITQNEESSVKKSCINTYGGNNYNMAAKWRKRSISECKILILYFYF